MGPPRRFLVESEIFVRNDAVLAEVDVKQRLIDLVAVPWDQEAEVVWRDEYWNEVFRRGAFDGLEEHVGRVRVNREHKIGDTVGKLVYADPQATIGLVVRAKIVRSDRGDDTLALAEDDAISASVGYRINKPEDVTLHRRTKLREVVRAFLDHLGLVEAPTFAEARVLAVRDKPDGQPTPPDFAHTLDEAWANPDYLQALDRLNRVPSGDNT
jgi:HK97 family phage prohead protease